MHMHIVVVGGYGDGVLMYLCYLIINFDQIKTEILRTKELHCDVYQLQYRYCTPTVFYKSRVLYIYQYMYKTLDLYM